MSELERFLQDIDADPDLEKNFGTVANRIALADNTLSESEVKARAISELGYKVTATDLEIYAAKNEHLDHEELEQVAGRIMPDGTIEEYICEGRYERGEIPFCWGKNQGCSSFSQDD